MLDLLAVAVPLAVKASVVLTVLALGLEATERDVLFLLSRPGRLLRSLLAMHVVVPLVAVILALTLDLRPPVKIALVALALSPVPPLLPRQVLPAGGRASYMIGLLAAAALLAVVVVPAGLAVTAIVFALPVHLSPLAVARVVLATVLAPLAAGVLVRRVAPTAAQRIARPLARGAMLLLAAAALPLLVTEGPAFVSLIGNGTLAAFAVLTVVALATGHALGGPEPDDRTVLALSTASRHPGVALAIASANFPEQRLVLPAILLYLVAAALLSVPYLRRRVASQAGSASSGPVDVRLPVSGREDP